MEKNYKLKNNDTFDKNKKDKEKKNLSIIKIFLIFFYFIFLPPFGLILSFLTFFIISIIFFLFCLITILLFPFFPFYFLFCLCSQNGIMLSKICLFLAFSSLLHLLIFILISIIGIIISILEFLKNYFFILTFKINPYKKFKENICLLMLFTFWFYYKMIDFLLNIRINLISKITSITN
jgi:hypothetical protein